MFRKCLRLRGELGNTISDGCRESVLIYDGFVVELRIFVQQERFFWTEGGYFLVMVSRSERVVLRFLHK